MKPFDLEPLDPEAKTQQQEELDGEPAWLVVSMLFLFGALAVVSIVAGFIVGVLESAWRTLRR